MKYTIIALPLLTIAIAAPIIGERADGGAGYTGAGGSAIGGDNTEVNSVEGGLLGDTQALDSNVGNAGNGGKATSGTAFGGHGASTVDWKDGHAIYYPGNGGAAYSGVGGNTNGGNKGEFDNNYGGGYGYWNYGELLGGDKLSVGNADSNNAGNGGDSSSGNAYGGNAAK